VTAQLHKHNNLIELNTNLGAFMIVQHLYNVNARKIVGMGLGPLDVHRICTTEINNMVLGYNFACRYIVDRMK